MDAYHALAVSYDRLTNDINYADTVEFYRQILEREHLQVRTAVDLACGTGSVALLLAQQGLQVMGVDMSEEKLWNWITRLCLCASGWKDWSWPVA